MLKNIIKIRGWVIFTILLTLLSLAGCGGSDGGSSSQILVLGESYDEKAGDIFTTSLI